MATCNRCNCEVNESQKWCEDCAYIVELEQMRKHMVKKRQKETGPFGPHPIKKNGAVNFKAEQRAILKEMKRLGLRA